MTVHAVPQRAARSAPAARACSCSAPAPQASRRGHRDDRSSPRPRPRRVAASRASSSRGGAAAAARALLRRRRVLITTGFTVGPGLPETDGPPGAACARPGPAPARQGGRLRDRRGRRAAAGRPRSKPSASPPPSSYVRARGRWAAARRARRRRVLAEQPADPPRGHRAAGPHPRRRLPERARRVGAPLERAARRAVPGRAPAHRHRRASATAATRSAWATCAPALVRAGGRLPRRIASVVRVRPPGGRGHLELGRLRRRGRAVARWPAGPPAHRAEEEARWSRPACARARWTGSRAGAEPTVDGLPLAAHRWHAGAVAARSAESRQAPRRRASRTRPREEDRR